MDVCLVPPEGPPWRTIRSCRRSDLESSLKRVTLSGVQTPGFRRYTIGSPRGTATGLSCGHRPTPDPGGIAMIQILVVSSMLLFLPAQAGGPAPAKDVRKAAAKIGPALSPDEALAKYNEMKAKTPKTVAAHSKLAMWCEEHGLKAESYVHYAEVVRLDPRREAAWRKLGYKKYGNRWMTDAQITELEDQKKAERTWLPRLKRIHKDIHGSNGARKRDQAQAALDAVTDPKAIPALYHEFVGSGQIDQLILIQVLGQIDKPLSTEVLAMLSIYGQTPEVRRRAAEILRGRPSEDYIELLVALMVDPLKYEVKPVGGPGLPGVLFVEGQQFNIARFYAPPAPTFAWRPGDIISFDASGMPMISRDVGGTSTVKGVPGSKTLVTQTTRTEVAGYSVNQMVEEAQKAAVSAEAQLEGDVAQVKAINADRRRFNDIVIAVAAYATGKDRGETAKEWRDALAAEKKYRKEPAGEPLKPTFAELVPLAYSPVLTPRLSFMTTTRTYVDT
jgi:hypothetical protein